MERAFTAANYVLRVVRDGGIFAGEYMRTGSGGGFVVEPDIALADEFVSRRAACDARRESADPDRLVVEVIRMEAAK